LIFLCRDGYTRNAMAETESRWVAESSMENTHHDRKRRDVRKTLAVRQEFDKARWRALMCDVDGRVELKVADSQNIFGPSCGLWVETHRKHRRPFIRLVSSHPMDIGSVGHTQICSIRKGASEGVMRWLSGDDSRDMWLIIGSSVGSVLPLTQTIPWGPGEDGAKSIDPRDLRDSHHDRSRFDSGAFWRNLAHGAE
jgi:hypothetical protein